MTELKTKAEAAADKLALLCVPFPESEINKLPKAGIQLDYVGHAAVTQRLLEVDPFWHWEPMAYDEYGAPLIKFNDRTGYTMWIKLTVCGVTRLGVGSVEGNKADIEKQLIGDALRNAAMRFGVALDLWKKDETHSAGSRRSRSNSEPSQAKQFKSKGITEKQMNYMLVLFGQIGIENKTDRLEYVRGIVGRADIESSKDLTMAEAKKLIDHLQEEAEAEQAPANVDVETGEVISA